MHIGSTKLLENGAATANYDSKKRLYGVFQGLNWGNGQEIKEVVADKKDDKDKAKDFWEKNKKPKKEKMRQKHLL